MEMFQIMAVCILLLESGNAQIFPFSNLRAFFDPKTKVESEVPKHNPEPGMNISRPYRQTNKDNHLPPLHEFDSPDIFTINREIENHRSPPVKRYPTSTEPPFSSTISKRRRNKNKYHARVEQSIHPTVAEDSAEHIFITPRSKIEQKPELLRREPNYSKAQPKRVRGRKPSTYLEIEQPSEPNDFGSLQTTSDNEQGSVPNSETRSAHPSSTESSFISEEPAFIESLPSVDIATNKQESDPNIGLVDYLVPPKLPSVYEKNLKPHKRRGIQATGISKRKPPHPTSFGKKESRFRIKNHHGELLSTVLPVGDRLTTKPKRMIHRRPAHHHVRDPPLRKPLQEKKPTRQAELEQQGQEMDEQITAETGLMGGASHPRPHHGERVEFQMHGQKGPNSYKFGYDTGKGHNRQFRFEEKDNHGHVKGHYGFYDKEGKLQVVNYEADPEHGFKAETV